VPLDSRGISRLHPFQYNSLKDIPLSHEYQQRAWAMHEVVGALDTPIKEISESSPEGLRDPRIADIAATAWGMLQRKHEDCSSAKPCVSIL
jgi:hypothetical protein